MIGKMEKSMGMDDMKMEKKSSTDGKSRRGSSKKKQ